MRQRHLVWITTMLAAATMAGCRDARDERLAVVAAEAVRQQAAQNHRMIDLQEKVARGSRELVEADAQARREMIGLHEKVIQEQSDVGRQRDQLDEERKSLGAERRRETLWAAVIHESAALLACLLPLAIALLLLWPRPDTSHALELNELLLSDFDVAPPVRIAPLRLNALPAPDASEPSSDDPPVSKS